MEEVKSENVLYTKISGSKYNSIIEKFLFKVSAIKVNDNGVKPIHKQKILKFYDKFFLVMKVIVKLKKGRESKKSKTFSYALRNKNQIF